MNVLKATMLSTVLAVAALLFLLLRDKLFGTPYDLMIAPNYIGESHLSANMEIDCNRVYTREIGLLIDPPVDIDSVSDAQASITGMVSLTVTQDNRKIDKGIDLSKTGYSLNSDGVWSKLIYRYEPIGSIWCRDQGIQVTVTDFNVPLSSHSVTLYVSRDRRP